jgi:hypothetical protein
LEEEIFCSIFLKMVSSHLQLPLQRSKSVTKDKFGGYAVSFFEPGKCILKWIFNKHFAESPKQQPDSKQSPG